jgi:hypothetical protein
VSRAGAIRILDGLDPSSLSRRVTRQMDEATQEYNDAADEHALRIMEKQNAWLRRKGLQ